MWEMPPIFNNHPNNPNQGPNQHQQQNQPPHFHNTMNDPLGINSQNGPPGPGPSPGHGHSHGHQHNPHSRHASGEPGHHPGPVCGRERVHFRSRWIGVKCDGFPVARDMCVFVTSGVLRRCGDRFFK